MKLSPRLLALSISAAFAAVPLSAFAQSTDAEKMKALEQKLERSMQLIEKLSAKVDQMEKDKTTAVAAPNNAEQQAKLEALERQVTQLGSGISNRSSDSGLPLHGFADVGAGTNRQNNVVQGKGNKGFTVGSLDLYLTPQFGDRVRSLVELVFEIDHNGDVATVLERVQMGYAFSDAATGWLGRFHTPYGYWNTAFHHGAQIQTAVSRPRFLDFEDKGGILPAHTTGAWLTGAMGASSGRFGYDIYAGNAPLLKVDGDVTTSTLSTQYGSSRGYIGTGTLNMRQGGSGSFQASVGGNVWFEPSSIDGLRLGLHALGANIDDDSVNRNRTRLGMLGAYATFTNDRWEVLGEYYNFHNKDQSSGTGTHSSWAGYMQAGYNIGRVTPYARLEKANLDQTDNYFLVQESGRSYSRAALGIRYDLDPKAAIKFEYLRTNQDDIGPGLRDKYNAASLQYAIRF
jgi:hypothetical protein